MKENLTIIFVSYFSEKKIIKYIERLDNKYKIIIIDNANDHFLEKNLKKLQNIEIITNKKNIGFGSATNQALRKLKTKYALHLDIDTNISLSSIDTMIKTADKIQDFAILAPKIFNHKYSNKSYIKKNYFENTHLMNFVEGCCLFFKVNEIEEIGYFDENFFLYYEETDLVKRLTDKNKKVILLDNISIEHEGRASVDTKYNDQIEVNRNWHYMWSKFYYHKKHFGYIIAFFKIAKSFFSSGLKSVFFSITGNKSKKDKYSARFSGCLNSILLKKSWYRPKL